jgi:hypothetical protein
MSEPGQHPANCRHAGTLWQQYVEWCSVVYHYVVPPQVFLVMSCMNQGWIVNLLIIDKKYD